LGFCEFAKAQAVLGYAARGARLSGLPATVANWIDQGLLKGHKTPTGRRRVEAEDLTSFLKAHEMTVPPELEGGNGHDVVVVVDDDPGYLKAIVLTIERSDLDLEVVEAATGVDALLEIGRVQPTLIVLDYSLPDLNAPEVIRRLLEPGRRLDAEVMVVTGGCRTRRRSSCGGWA